MEFGEIVVRELSRAVVPAELFAILHDTDGGESTDTTEQLQFSGVAVVEIEDGVFLAMLRCVIPADGVSPERIGYAGGVKEPLSFGFPFCATYGIRYAEGVVSLFPFGSPFGITYGVSMPYGVFALFPGEFGIGRRNRSVGSALITLIDRRDEPSYQGEA